MSVSMEWDESEMETVPLDLTMKKEENYAVSEAKVELDGPGTLTEDTPLPQSIAKNDVQSTPLDLSARRALPLQPPPPRSLMSLNVAQRATVVVLSQKVQVESSPPPSPPSKPQLQCRNYGTPVLSSPTEHLAPLHGMYSNAAAYQHKVSSSAAVPKYNTSPPVLPTSTANEFHQNNRIQQQLQDLHMQQQQLLHLQNQLKLQQQLQSQLHHLCNEQKKLQMQAAYGGIPLNPTSSPSSSESNHFQSLIADDHHQQPQQQWDLDPEHRPHIEACATDDSDVVDPEEVAAIYRQSEFLSLRQRYMESLKPPRNINKIRQSSNNNNNNNNNSSCSNDNDNRGLTAGQQQKDQTSIMKRKRNNEAARRSWGAKRQKYFENQVKVMYLNKKVSEMKDIKKRLLKANGNILAK